MDTESLKRALAITLASYAKRWMESGVYDRIMNTELGQQLRGLDPKAKYGIEGVLYVLTALLDQKFADDTAVKALVKELGMDAGPEIAKRMINGGEGPAAQTAAPLPSPAAAKGNPPSVLLALGQDQLSELLLWLSAIEADRRKGLIAGLGRLSADDLAKFVAMNEVDRGRFAQHFLGIDDEAAFTRVMGVAEQAKENILETTYWTVMHNRLRWKEIALGGGTIHVDRYLELLERWLSTHPGKTESDARHDEDFRQKCLSEIRVRTITQERESEARVRKETASSNRTIIALWVLLGVALVAMIILNH